MNKTTKLALLLAGLHFTGAAIYGLIVPVFEGPDESAHFEYIRFIALNWRLPNVLTEYGGYAAVGTHGPLYHTIAAVAVQSLDLTDTAALPATNPQATSGDFDILSNKNGHIHTALEAWPYRADIIRAVHIARLISAAFGALTVAATVLLAARISTRVALLAGLFVGALPEFLFLGSLANNDVPGAALAACSILLLVRYWEHPGWKSALPAGLAIGLTILAKVGGVWLLPLAAITVLLQRRSAWKPLFTEGLLILAGCLLVSGWWMVMNIVRYGDPTALTGNLALMPGEQLDYTNLATLYAMIRRTTFTFWAVFGATTIAAPDWVYVTLTLLALIALAGIGLVQRPPAQRAVLFLSLGWALLITAAGSAWQMRVASWHGRLFFAGIGAYGVLVAIGIDGWRQRWPAGAALYALPGGMLLLAILAPPLLIRPAYAPPPVVERLPAGVEPRCLQFDALTLLGVEAANEVAPGDVLQATFYWRLNRPVTYDEFLSIRLLDGELDAIAGDNTYPGSGNWPTQLWTPNVIYADTVQLRVDSAATVPTLARLLVQVDHYGQDVPPTCDGNPLDPLTPLASVRVVVPQPPPPETLVVLGEVVELATAGWQPTIRPGETLVLDLVWYVRAAPGRDLTRFVHLERDGVLIAQNDSVAAGFSALAWQPGDVLPDRVSLTVPPAAPAGTYTIIIGMYDSVGARLSATAPDDRVPIGVVEVAP